MIQLPIALQAYSLRRIYEDNPLRALKLIREAGYDGVELYGTHFQTELYPALLREAGLVCAGWHTGIDALEQDFDNTLRRNLAVGNHSIAVPWFNADSAAGWKAFAERLNAAAEKLSRYGIRLGYHNHHFEFIRLPGTKKTMLETFYDDTDSRCVSAEIDVHWVTRGGGSPVRWIRKVAGRMPVIHFKDFAVIGNNEPAFCEIGEGNLDWPAIIEACRETGVRWYSIEQDALFQNRDIFDSIKISFDNLKAMGVK